MNTINILIVDDNIKITKTIFSMLKENGFHTISVHSGEEAISMVEQMNIHLIIMDIMMPKTNGFVAIAKIREKYNCPIIILSAKSNYYTNSIPLNSLFTTAFLQQFIWGKFPVAILCVTVYWYFVENKKFSFSLIIVAAACLLPCFLLHINHTWILADELNVLYTFALGFVVFYVLDTLKRCSFKWYERGILVAASILAVVAYGTKADYGICLIGLLLLVSLYLCNGSRAAESICILAWGIVSYGIVISNKYYLMSVLFAVIPVMLYNQKPGKRSKTIKFLFYSFYPLHLLVIGLCNIYIRFCV